MIDVIHRFGWVVSKTTSTSLVDWASCLLYTSDAADERSSVDLGGRRIIKKKKRRTADASMQTHTKTINQTRTEQDTKYVHTKN